MSARFSITLVRHGQADWTPEPERIAVQDPGLTEMGRLQADALATRLAGEQFDLVLTSPLQRARQTADVIGPVLGTPVVIVDWLAELLIPVAGKTASEVATFYANARFSPPAEWWAGFGAGNDGAETFEHFSRRVVGGLESVLGSLGATCEFDGTHAVWKVSGRGARILVVGHGGTNGVLLTWLLGIPAVPWEWIRFGTSLASITRLRTVQLLSGAIWTLERFSETGHLAGLQPGPTRTLDFNSADDL